MSDGEGRTLKVSSGCERIWGYKETELLGKTVYELEKRGHTVHRLRGLC
ncbi:PAS domain S-box protein [Bacillus megaterium NBRC 15308 = ATCC 14581]|nr:PAS domain S-box protein [Priestia megaterium NBRC 15308 = ATCC 14581]